LRRNFSHIKSVYLTPIIDSTEKDIFGFVDGFGGGTGKFTGTAGLEEAKKRAAAVKKLAVLISWLIGGVGKKRAEEVTDSSSLSAKARLLRARSLRNWAEAGDIGNSAD